MTIRWLRQVLGRGAPLCICVRQSPDWRGTPRARLIEDSRAFCRMIAAPTGLPENFIADIVEIWDRTFPLPFFEVRAALKDIAQANLRAVENSRQVLAGEWTASDANKTRLILFIDDDDWLHPRIWSLLAPQISSRHDGYIFGNVLCTAAVELREIADGCYTNNYAVAAEYLQRQPQAFAALEQHWDANRVFHDAAFRFAIPKLYLSATNKHPASTMKLKDGLHGQSLSAALLTQLVERYVDESSSAAVPAQAQWIAPFRGQTRALFATLLKR